MSKYVPGHIARKAHDPNCRHINRLSVVRAHLSAMGTGQMWNLLELMS